MKTLLETWRRLFDIRPGEYQRTIFMSLYLLFILFSYYILKSASESMFLNKFDIDKLPNLYILMAIFGGILAVVYSKAAARTSLHTAVTATVFISIACLIGMWYPLRTRNATIVYVFAVWVRMFSIITVTQGWVVATNLFTSREAKRVYGLLGMGMVAGAIFGGEFTTQVVRFTGTNNLLFASAPLVLVAYGCYLVAVAGPRGATVKAGLADAGEAAVSLRGMAGDIARNRHIQVLMFIMSMQFMVDTFIDYQFKYMAKAAFHGDALTAFFGRFYGRYLNISELVLQFFFTTAIVKRLGVGGTLQVMPVSLAAASGFTLLSPSVISASLARLVEASTRYTLARTGNELFYMPLPLELRNRVKGFVDIFMDRAARGVSGFILLLFVRFSLGVRAIALLTICITIPWIALTVYAHREYLRTIRRRLESRRLDLESARIVVADADTVRALEAAAESSNARQAAYALSLLGEAPSYDPERILQRLAGSPSAEVRAQVYEIARVKAIPALTDRALAEVRTDPSSAAAQKAIAYLLSVSPDRSTLAREFVNHLDPAVQEAAIEALAATPEAAGAITAEWIARAAGESDPRRRAIAAAAIAARRDGSDGLQQLLADSDLSVVAAACRAAGALGDRASVFAVARCMADYRVRGAAIDALVRYGPAIGGTLGDMMDDGNLPLAVRSGIPRVLRRIPHQRSVDLLLAALRHPERAVRSEALKGVIRLRQDAPNLAYASPLLKAYVLNEAHRYYELAAAADVLAPYREKSRSAVSLLARTVDERLAETRDNMFHMLAISHPPAEMEGARRALATNDRDRHSAAVDFLDTVLEPDLKKVLVPIFDAPERVKDHGQALFGVEPCTVESAIANLLHAEDPWLASAAIAAAAELKLQSLSEEVTGAREHRNAEVRAVAINAAAAMGIA